eukprot:TRINITY_DN15530_c0_g1_i2.p1 TRINITY_DN15530_c0_g1~~TRINITY_DN15530_c0_g1_i2.p1  ORF type:complete len:894 (+),score=199.25 TRINITY_DN15530_c0_g1_i2:215-2896(+)
MQQASPQHGSPFHERSGAHTARASLAHAMHSSPMARRKKPAQALTRVLRVARENQGLATFQQVLFRFQTHATQQCLQRWRTRSRPVNWEMLYMQKVQELAVHHVVGGLRSAELQGAREGTMHSLHSWIQGTRNHSTNLRCFISVLKSVQSQRFMSLTVQSLVNWTESARDHQVSKICLERILRIHGRCSLKVLRQIGFRWSAAECCGAVCRWKAAIRGELESALNEANRENAGLMMKVASLTAREQETQVGLSRLKRLSGNAITQLEMELERLRSLASSQQEQNHSLQEQLTEMQQCGQISQQLRVELHAVQEKHEATQEICRLQSDEFHHKLNSLQQELDQARQREESTQHELQRVEQRVAQLDSELQAVQAEREMVRVSQECEWGRIREADSALDQVRKDAQDNRTKLAKACVGAEALQAQNLAEKQQAQGLQQALSDAQEQLRALGQESASLRDVQQQSELHKKCAEELELELRECRGLLLNEKMTTTRTLLKAESWRQRAEMLEVPSDPDEFEKRLLKVKSSRKETEADWKSKSADWQNLAENQIAEYKALAENSNTLMNAAEEKWKLWAEESVVSLTQERDGAVKSKQLIQADKRRLEHELAVTQESVNVLAALEDHQRTLLEQTAARCKKIGLEQALLCWLLNSKEHHLQHSVASSECLNAVSQVRNECSVLLETTQTRFERKLRAASTSIEQQHTALQDATDAQYNFACDHTSAQLAYTTAEIASKLLVSQLQHQVVEQRMSLQETWSSLQEQKSAHQVALCKFTLFRTVHLCVGIRQARWMAVQCWSTRAQAARELQVVAQLLGEQVVHDPEPSSNEDAQTIQHLRSNLQEASQLLKTTGETWKSVLIQSGCVATIQILSRLRRLLLRGTFAAWLTVVHLSLIHI